MRPPAVGLGVPSGPKRARWVSLAGRRNWSPAHKGDQVPRKIFPGLLPRLTMHSPDGRCNLAAKVGVKSGSPETALLEEAASLFDMRERTSSEVTPMNPGYRGAS